MKYTTAKHYNSDLFGLSLIEDGISQLLNSADYLEEAEKQALIDCCFYAAEAHKTQKRKSGEPYITHPIKVAEILAREVQFDLPVLQAGVLHDVIEDTDVSKSEVATFFDDEVAGLVDGVSKLEKSQDVSPEELQAKTFAKLAIAMEADPRVVMIKFADRVHNMQTLGALRAEKRRRIAKETLEVYVLIAERLGMSVFKKMLEELAFMHQYPWRHRIINNYIEQTHSDRENIFGDIQGTLNKRFEHCQIKASIRKLRRNAYSSYLKLQKTYRGKKVLEKGSLPLIVITETREECYRALGIIHECYTPVMGKLTDYIASNKTNGYQSIHTAVIAKDGRAIHFKIRTKQMHAVAEAGIVAIWREHNQTKGMRCADKDIRHWLRNIKGLNDISSSPIEFYEAVKSDLKNAAIQVLTPKGRRIGLPLNATVIDFAYYIHTELGDHLASANVNGVEVGLDQPLKNGQTVEVFTNASASPYPSWLRRVKTDRARASIRNRLRELPEEKLAAYGYKDLLRYLSRNEGMKYTGLRELITEIARRRNMSANELLGQVATRDIRRSHVFAELQKLTYKDYIQVKIGVIVLNRAGVLADVIESMGAFGVNILHMSCDEDIAAEEIKLHFLLEVENLEQREDLTGELIQNLRVKKVLYEDNK